MNVSRERAGTERPQYRIGVVDDDPGVRRALSRLLRVTGHQVRTFGSAEELLALGRLGELDCLVLDVYLGGMSGVDLHTELTTVGQPPPTVFITAHDDAIVATRCLCADGVVCLPKPFEDDALLTAITQAMGAIRP
jgi:FixJ family two-component response regulator